MRETPKTQRENTPRDANIGSVLTYDQRLENFEKRQTRIRIGIMFTMFSIAGFLFWRNANYVVPTPEPNSSGYYAGPWVNKNGDLVSGDGKILKERYGVPAGGPNGKVAKVPQNRLRTRQLPTNALLEP